MKTGSGVCPLDISEHLIADMNQYAEMTAVNSTAIRAVGYDGHTLTVQFHTSDTTYCHHGVPYSLYAEFMRASSMGAFYNRYIRGNYQ
jgi:hypothetical protein